MTKLNAIPVIEQALRTISLTEICLYSSKFQRLLGKLEKMEQQKIDRIIKEYIGIIRKARDCQFAKGKLPEEAKIETTNYRPSL